MAIATFAILISDGKQILGQVVSDGTTDTKTDVSQNLTTITGGTQRGANLFHSFKQFSLSAGSAAYFNNAIEIENIFSRVTGGSISEIDGAIAANGNSSLFIINPAGIVFGENVSLNIGGSFIATTSDKLVFDDGSEYSAVEPFTTPLLTVSSPIGLQYGSASGEIASSSNSDSGSVGLAVTPGNTLALIGNNISLKRTNLSAFNGEVLIGSVASGRANLEADNNSWNLDYAGVTKFGQITLSQSFIDTSGVGGVSSLRGEAIELINSGISNFTLIDGDGGKIQLLTTKSINIEDSFLSTQVGSNLNDAIAGTGGDILIKAPQINFTNGSIVSAGTLSFGRGGNVVIEATEFVELSGGNPSLITTSTQGSGAGGKLTVSTEKLVVRDGSQFQALAGEGNGGAIAIDASDSVELSGTGTRLFGSTEVTSYSGLFASSGDENLPFELQPSGRSGDLTVNTPSLSITDNARISVSNFGRANAGNIEINAAEVNLKAAGEIIANTASGRGGSIRVNSDDLVILQQAAQISTNAERDGNGGNINLAADSLVLQDESKIAADAQEGSGGNIEIATRGYFIDVNSGITASSSFGTDGVVEIFTPDADSNIETTQPERSPITAESSITTGCSASGDFVENQFRNVGRGGLPPDIRERTTKTVFLEDLGFSQPSTATDLPFESFQISTANENKVIEANDWIVNSSGKVELIAQTTNSVVVSQANCQF